MLMFVHACAFHLRGLSWRCSVINAVLRLPWLLYKHYWLAANRRATRCGIQLDAAGVFM